MQPQRSFADVEYDGKKRQTRRERFLQRMDGLIPWRRLEAAPPPDLSHRGAWATARIPWPVMLRIHCVQLFYNLSDPAMEDALYEIASIQRFVGVSVRGPLPDETTILNFRHLLERHGLGDDLLAEITQHLAAQGVRLREGTIVDATILDAPASTKNRAQAARPRDASGEEGEPVVLRDEGPHWGGCPDGSGAQRGNDGGERGGCDAGAGVAPWWRDAGVGGRGLSGRVAAPGAPGPGHGLAGGPAARAAATLGAGQRGRAHGAAQGGAAGEEPAPDPDRGSSIPFCT